MLFAEHLKSNSVSFKKNRVKSPVSRGTMHSTNVSGRSGYASRSSPVLKDFPMTNSFDEKRSYSGSPESTRYRNSSEQFEDSRTELSSNGYLNRNGSHESSLDFLPNRFNQPLLSFKTKTNCHKISIYFGDLTKMKADAIVNAANSYLHHFGGVAKAIADAGGYKVVEESNKYIKKWGPLYPSRVIQTSGGRLPAKYVIHAVGPVWKDYKHEKDCLDTLKATFMNCFQLASKGLDIKHIALPLISSGIFGVPIEKCVQSLYLALMEFDVERNSPLDIHIVDTSVEVIRHLQALFSQYLRLDDIQFDTMESDRSLTQTKDRQTDALSNDNLRSKRASESSNKRNVVDKIKSKVSKMGKSDFKVKENAKLSPTNGPMKALSSHQSQEEAWLHKVLEEHQRKGYPLSEFKEIQSLFDGNTKTKRSKSLGRLPSRTVDLEELELNTSERQSRRKSRKNNTLDSKEQPTYSRNESSDRSVENSSKRTGPRARSQSWDRTKTKDEERKKEKEQESNYAESIVKREGSRTRSQSSDRTKTKDEERKKEKEQVSDYSESIDNSRRTREVLRPRAQSLDRYHQRSGKQKDAEKAFTVSSQQPTYITRCSFCHGKTKLRKRRDCSHMICQLCRTIYADKSTCFDCKQVEKTHLGNNIEHSKEVSTTTEVKKYSMLSPTFDLSALSSNFSARNSSAARTKRREKLSSEQNPPDEITQRQQRDYSESTSSIASQSPMKDIKQFLLPLPESVEESCPICLSDCQDPVSLKNCNHIFCKQCIISAFKTKPACPICGVIYGCLVGNQPDGTMEIGKVQSSLPEYEGYGTIIIQYYIPSGIQNESHPNPGSRYKGTSRSAYLPNTPEGQDICRLLKNAFDAKLIFTVGRSVTTGASNVVTWNDIHHKTSCTGGPSQFGYPDDTYLERVRDELAAKGIR
ncbi:uncharacterized protein [Antedon mediterranea]|uniref:uncharacterized protein n=1 Tax=Antedon mediterranea TaxID=105859 RepID=UPI003AF640C0